MPPIPSDVPPGQLARPVTGYPHPAFLPQIQSNRLNSLRIIVTVAAIQAPQGAIIGAATAAAEIAPGFAALLDFLVRGRARTAG